jgi:hypothetical protein
MNNGLPAYRKEHPGDDAVATMVGVLSGNAKYEAYVYVREIFAIALSITISTCIVESGYSVINAIKDKKKNALGDDSLEDLLNILFNGPPEMPVYFYLCVVFFVLC